MGFVRTFITESHPFSTRFSSFPPLWTMQNHPDLGRVSAHRVSEQLEKAKWKKYTVSPFRKKLFPRNMRFSQGNHFQKKTADTNSWIVSLLENKSNCID